MSPWEIKVPTFSMEGFALRVHSALPPIDVLSLIDPDKPIDYGKITPRTLSITTRTLSIFDLATGARDTPWLRAAFDRDDRVVYVQREPTRREGMWLLQMADRFDGVHWYEQRIKRAARHVVQSRRAALVLHAMAEVERERSEFYRDEFLEHPAQDAQRDYNTSRRNSA